MKKAELFDQIEKKASFLCVGLDTVMHRIPKHLLSEKDPIFEFNKQIIDATIDFAVAYKPNIAFYEAEGVKGWESLQKTIEYLPKNVFTIADAKRGDIGNTSERYAKAFFDLMNFDSITVSPYMGSDSVKPFLAFEGKWVILLAVTSNEGGMDFQYLDISGQKLYKKVIRTSAAWGSDENMMYVVGATHPEILKEVRKTVPDHFLLIPGIGAQGGDLKAVCESGLNKNCGLLVNSSRGIIYADGSKNFAKEASLQAEKIQKQMAETLQSI
ncbi:MAG: orotidine-5'-phosphate decarboxylase [Ekhidna sp.]|nr:orotidine-5'-phosphate decarboxylase [Ekhidna sp.]MBC6409908.1 orotidine-5'-phosphate decarboxylase [Ekhidna sp.]MBC6425518.1 orotidine-5'-phosphate decarboxylase [Ekhidna sp.]